MCKKWLEARHAAVKTPKTWGIQIAWGRCLPTILGTQVCFQAQVKGIYLRHSSKSLSLRSEEREDLAIIQQLVANFKEEADAIRDPHASTTLDIIALPR